jgi:hypothetical protein
MYAVVSQVTLNMFPLLPLWGGGGGWEEYRPRATEPDPPSSCPHMFHTYVYQEI